MPRDGQSIYSYPPGTEGIPDTTIESGKYNVYIADVADDLNRPRPVLAGGTGSSSATGAIKNLGAEKASQVVNNYDTHVWFPGSFYSAIGATAAPVAGHAFVGWVVSSDPLPVDPAVHVNQNVVVHARDQNGITVPGRVYVREKKAGVWGPWSIDGTGITQPTPPVDPPDGLLWWDNISGQLYVWYNDGNSKQWVIASPSPDPAQFLLKAGDTMTGVLGLFAPPVNDLDAVNKKYVDDIAQTVTDEVLPALDDKVSKLAAGDTMAGDLTISKENPALILNKTTESSAAVITGDVNGSRRWLISPASNTTSDFVINRYSDSGTFTGHALSITRATGAVSIPGTVSGGSFNATGDVTSGGSLFAANGVFLTNTTANLAGNTIVLRPNGWNSGAGQVSIANGGSLQLTSGSFIPSPGAPGGVQCKDGGSNALGGDYFNIYYSGSPQLWLSNIFMGNISLTSDYRTKKDVVALASTWGAVKALRPIKYTQTDFTPPAKENTGTPFVVADDVERWGFMAHELQETLTPSAASGVKDMPDGLQSPNTITVVAALAKALQEAMARIEALEARG